jgi:hypothetical protein
VDFTEALRTVTYWLRVHRQGEKIRWTHRSTKNSHLLAEDAQTWRKDQVDFTEALKTVTDILRVHREKEKIRWTSQRH